MSKNTIKDILKSGNNDQIKNLILENFSKKNGPKKSYSFYISLANLYDEYPQMARDLIDTIPEWGYWKDYFLLLTACKNPDLEDYIYDLLANQLEEDMSNHESGQDISNLAKWIPKQSKSFDKKLNFVTNICKRLYPDDKPITARKKYRKIVSALNKKLGTTEILLCSQNYSEIDFDKVPNLCLKKNMKTFLKNNESRNKLHKHLFKKYIKLDFKGFLDKVVFRTPSNFEKDILRDVWRINRFDFCDQIEELIGVNPKNADVVIDMSHKMYNEKLINIPVGVAALANSFGNNVIVNAYSPYKLELSGDRYNSLEYFDKISQECADYEFINFEEILNTERNLVKKKNLLVVTNKAPRINDTYNGKPKIIYWMLTKDNQPIIDNDYEDGMVVRYGNFYDTKNYSKEITNKNKDAISNIITNSNENYPSLCNLYLFTGFLIASYVTTVGLAFL